MSQKHALQRATESEIAAVPAELAPLVAMFAPILEKLGQLLHESPRLELPAQPQLAAWITIEQAVECSGLSDCLLRRLVKAGRITGVLDGRWKVRKADIESFDPAMLQDLPSLVELKKRGRRKP